jgi:ubiquinone/menaquinone biosynthesis C-methylase UbiE
MSVQPATLLNNRAARAYLDFVADARSTLMNVRWGAVTSLGSATIAAYEQRTSTTVDSVATVRDALLKLPEMSAFFRVKRTLQEACWQRIIDACAPIEAQLLDTVSQAEQQGPGNVSWNPAATYPDYARVDIHIQPGGYTQHPLAGLIYDLGTQVFFGGGNIDAMHAATANRTLPPLDGRVACVVDIGCSVGQMTCALKQRFPEANVWGTDISGPMVRYAHWRAVQNNCDVQFAQMPAEQLNFSADEVDLIVAHIVFHELPVAVIRQVIREAMRVLRPGGALVIWDFPTATADNPSFATFMGIMDAADNGEPYVIPFVRCDVEKLLCDAGFTLRSTDPKHIQQHGRIADKPTA